MVDPQLLISDEAAQVVATDTIQVAIGQVQALFGLVIVYPHQLIQCIKPEIQVDAPQILDLVEHRSGSAAQISNTAPVSCATWDHLATYSPDLATLLARWLAHPDGDDPRHEITPITAADLAVLRSVAGAIPLRDDTQDDLDQLRWFIWWMDHALTLYGTSAYIATHQITVQEVTE